MEGMGIRTGNRCELMAFTPASGACTGIAWLALVQLLPLIARATLLCAPDKVTLRGACATFTALR